MTTGLPDSYDPEDDDLDLPQVSERSRSVALVLGFLGGVFGLHRFYVGRARSGALMAVTFGGLGLWWLYDMVMLVAGEFRDSDELPLRNWNVAESVAGGGVSSRRVQQLTREMEEVQRQLGELAERVDFAERLLTQQRERDRLPKGS
ncbi:MAG: TM2 domain-containing protein [Gemmatimonadales bacterium]